MSTDGMSWKGSVNPKVLESQEAQDCLLPMGKHAALLVMTILMQHGGPVMGCS